MFNTSQQQRSGLRSRLGFRLKFRLGFGLASGLMLMAASPGLLAETGYVQAHKARILASPSAKAEVLTIIKKGDTVDIIEAKGRWLNVNVDGQEGWVSKLLIKDKPPQGKITVFETEDSSLEERARRRASTANSAAATRGLRSEERARQSDEGIADFGAVRQLESEQVSEEEAIEFLEQVLEK
ncbi:SH3 domain-containing protein [Pseudomonadota bacterium]